LPADSLYVDGYFDHCDITITYHLFSLCYKTRRDARLEDWRARVVSIVDDNQDEYIVTLNRSFDIFKEKYANILLESFELIQLEKVKNLNDLRRQLFLFSVCSEIGRDSGLKTVVQGPDFGCYAGQPSIGHYTRPRDLGETGLLEDM
jgi:hypothetical protein